MKKLQPTTQFRKDFKRIKNDPEKIALLKSVLLLLQNGKPVPAELFPHKLHGKFKNCMECHIQCDFLLIWYDKKMTSSNWSDWAVTGNCLKNKFTGLHGCKELGNHFQYLKQEDFLKKA